MRKIIIACLCLVSSVYTKEYCAFCDPSVLQQQKFYEDDLVVALYTHKPIFSGHCLIIPKRHIERYEMLTDAEALQMTQTIKKVHKAVQKAFHTSSYLLLQKNGSEVGQTVPHVHIHYIPRSKGDSSTLKFLGKMFVINILSPIKPAEMQENIQKIKEAM